MEIMYPLIVFTFFECIAGGTFAAQGLLTLQGKGKSTQFLSTAVALAALVVGGLGSFFHLQHATRALNGFGHITSGITIEIIDCAVLGIALVVFFLMYRRAEDGQAPKWTGIMAVIIGLIFPVVIGCSYLMASVPVWNTPLLPLYYLCNAAVMGVLVNLILTEVKGEADVRPNTLKVALVATVVFLIVVVVYGIYISTLGSTFAEIDYYFDPTLPDVGMVDTTSFTSGVIMGGYAPMFWLGVVIVGIVAPLVLIVLAKKLKDAKKVITYAALALILTVIGGWIWRILLYIVAIHAFPLY